MAQSIIGLLNYDRLAKKPILFKSFTGLELSELITFVRKSNQNTQNTR